MIFHCPTNIFVFTCTHKLRMCLLLFLNLQKILTKTEYAYTYICGFKMFIWIYGTEVR